MLIDATAAETDPKPSGDSAALAKGDMEKSSAIKINGDAITIENTLARERSSLTVAIRAEAQSSPRDNNPASPLIIPAVQAITSGVNFGCVESVKLEVIH